MFNKIYFFKHQEDKPGVFIAAANYQEAKNIATCSLPYKKQSDIKGGLFKKDGKLVYTAEFTGLLIHRDLLKLGFKNFAWEAGCDDCGKFTIIYPTQDGSKMLCNECFYIEKEIRGQLNA